ncbi:MAG: hypothetical protein IKE51_00450 [Solobacterium sp.]|nr:hypothetical protein [Solobacterium sp.]
MVTRTYRDSLFRFLFGRSEHKDWLLSLYNALNNSNYTDPEEIELTTIDNVIYLGLRNDVSFIIGDDLMMVEHQTTPSKNMSIRFLLYYAKILEGYLQKRDIDLHQYSSIPLPNPRFIVFYNGSQETGEQNEEYLSVHFSSSSNVELRVEFFNINKGMNDSLKKGCKVLEEYCWVNDRIGYYRATMTLEDAFEKMYDEILKGFVICPLIQKHKAEVKGVILETFDKERFGKTMFESGVEQGISQGIELERRIIIRNMIEKGFTVEDIMKCTNLSKEEVEEVINQ